MIGTEPPLVKRYVGLADLRGQEGGVQSTYTLTIHGDNAPVQVTAWVCDDLVEGAQARD